MAMGDLKKIVYGKVNGDTISSFSSTDINQTINKPVMIFNDYTKELIIVDRSCTVSNTSGTAAIKMYKIKDFINLEPQIIDTGVIEGGGGQL